MRDYEQTIRELRDRNFAYHYSRDYLKNMMDDAADAIEELLSSAQPTDASCWGCSCQKMERLKEQKTFSEMVHLHDAETHGNAQF